MAVNCYPACPEPEITLGMPPHSDFGSLTILLQSSQGLQIMDSNKNWISVPYIEGALLVQLGDQVEVMSNGIYKSVIHRVTVNKYYKRLSFASLHSLPLHKKISPAPELVGNNAPAYGEFSFNDFLDYISSNDCVQQRFIDTLKKSNSWRWWHQTGDHQGNFHGSSLESSLVLMNHVVLKRHPCCINKLSHNNTKVSFYARKHIIRCYTMIFFS